MMDDTSVDEIEVCQNIEPHEVDSSVKSKAVVKFAAVQAPANFTRLQCNTDLNLPPSNWLSSSANTYGLQQALYHSTGFASFRMAHMFPDCLGEVDVVSDAENIKKLLKLPYSPKGAVSMVVHKIGNTLLIDEFDIQKYLLRKADDDWKWLRTFILENILSSLSEKDRNFCLKDKSRVALQRKNLLSKFLYHSLQQASESKAQSNVEVDTADIRPLPLAGPVLPEANVEENVPDPKSNHVFNRNVVWTFEDIRMLIGTDMPIFGGGTRPCISLRLRDMTKPINVLTGIDYWLDNLMCNVPEVVMCYHLDGIVQKYEIIKTEDLPYLENSQFSPQVIRNVAQNILAFLKANATKAGHTYWLFKGKNDDVVKLYDLTTLCKNENCDPKYENPFTVPVAMLLYTVARNLKNSSERITSKKAGSIKALLDNCIKLLPKEKYPQIVTSSHYILSDLHIPAGIDPKSPNFDNGDLDSDTQSVYDDDYNTDCYSPDGDEEKDIPDEMSNNIAMKSICDTLKEFNGDGKLKSNRSPSPLSDSVEERCKISLQHISDGMDCLQYFETHEEKITLEEEQIKKESERQKIIHEEQHPNMAKPFQPIPLPYESLKPEPKIPHPDIPIAMGWEEKSIKVKRKGKGKKCKDYIPDEESSEVDKNDINQKLVIKEKSKMFGSWNVHLKLLLLEKACLTYATLAEQNYTLENYGTCLRFIYMSLRCQHVVSSYMSSMESQKSCLLGRVGDCFFQFAKNLDNMDLYLEQFQDLNEIDKTIMEQLGKDVENVPKDILPEPTKNVEKLMLTSCDCYETALYSANEQSRSELVRRLGSVRNELGVKYMYWAQEEYNKFTKPETEEKDKEEDQENPTTKKLDSSEPLYQTLAKQSFDNLTRGIASFEEVNDNVNLSFLLCNMGRFMRFRAHIHLEGEDPDDIRKQKKFYAQAFSYYQRALGILETRKLNPDLWDLVNWELSTATFTLAKQVQDFSNQDLSTEEVEREIVELLQKSLKLCEVEYPGSRQVLYNYRSGLIHYRLASFYHNQVRKAKDESTTKKTNLQLCRLHYEKVSRILESLKEIKDFLVVQLERVALQEHLANTAGNTQKIRLLQNALEICFQTKPIFDHITENGLENVSSDEISRLLKLFESRLQFALKTLAKLCLTKSIGKESKKLANIYKQMYSATLNVSEIQDEQKFAEHLSKVLDKIMNIEKNK